MSCPCYFVTVTLPGTMHPLGRENETFSDCLEAVLLSIKNGDNLLHMVQKHLRPSIQMCTIIVSQSVFGFVILTVTQKNFRLKTLSLHPKSIWQSETFG